jgi:hypothetical protein
MGLQYRTGFKKLSVRVWAGLIWLKTLQWQAVVNMKMDLGVL